MNLTGSSTLTGDVTVSAGSLNLTGSINSANSVTVSSGTTLIISGSKTLNNLTGAGNVTNTGSMILDGDSSTVYSGVISGTGNLNLVKGIGSSFTITNAQTFSGSFTFGSGTLVLSGSGSIATASGVSFPTGQGIAMNIETSTTLPNLASNVTGGGAPIITVSSGNTLTLNNTSDTSFGSVIAGAGNLTKIGTGKFTFADPTEGSVNTYTGVTTVTAGTLTVANSIATTSNVVNNATLEFDTASGSTTFSKVISGTGALVKSGSNTLFLNAVNTYSGATTVNGGTLTQTIASSIPSTTAMTLADTSGVILNMNGVSLTLASLAGGGSNGGNISNATGDGIVLTVGDSNSTTYSGIISGTMSFVKQGSGTLNFSGVNTYTGTTTINAGTLTQGVSGSIPSTAISLADVAGATLSLNDIDLTVTSFSGGGSTGGNISLGSGTITTGNSSNQSYGGVISGTGGLTKQGSGTLTLSNTNTYSGVTTITAGTLNITGALPQTASISNSGTIQFDTTAGDLSLLRVISGTGVLVKAGTNTLSLDTVDQTYTGATRISGGTLKFFRTNQISSSSAVFFTQANTSIDMNGFSQSFGSIATDSTGVTIVNGGGNLTVGSDNTSTLFTGVISGTGTFTKAGTGTLVLTGENTYTGATTVSAGTLRTNKDLNASTSIAISSGATLDYAPADGESLTLTKVVSGAGTFTKSGAGTLTVSSENTMTGPLTISGGTLSLADGQAFTNVSSTTMSSGTTINVANGETGNLPVLSGAGAITLNSSGAVNFQVGNGSSTFTGTVTGAQTTSLSAVGGNSNRITVIGDQTNFQGLMRASGSSILTIRGSFANAARILLSGATSVFEADTTNGNLSFDDTNLLAGGGLVGDGTLKVIGGNTLNLTWTEPQAFFTGAIEVVSGSLNITGSVSSSGTTTVSSGATLRGTGTYNNIVCSGTVRPGNSIGTITIVGNYTQSSGSTLDIEIDAFGNNSLLDITGTATIASNTTLNVIPNAGTRYKDDQIYTFIDADGGLTGTFSNITIANDNLGGATFTIEYTGNLARIVLAGSNLAIDCDTALLSVTSNLAARVNRIQQGMVEEVQNQRLMEVFYCPQSWFEQEEAEDPHPKNSSFFVNKERKAKDKILAKRVKEFYHPYAIYDFSRDRMHGVPSQTSTKDIYRSAGAGCDFYFLKQFILGASVGFTSAYGHSLNDCGFMTSDTYSLGLYFQSEILDGLYIDGSAQAMKSYYEIRRIDIDEGTKLGKPHGYEINSQLRFLAQKSLYGLRIRPYISWDYYRQLIGTYHERRDGDNVLYVQKDRFYMFDYTLGMSVWYPFWLGRCQCWNLVPNIGFGYTQALARNKHSVNTSFVTTPTSYTNTPILRTSKTFWTFDAGVSTYFHKCAELFFTYKGIFDRRYATNQEYRVGARASF